MTDRSSYLPGSAVHVKFLVTNTGKEPLYFLRPVARCSSPLGSLHLDIRDQRGRDVIRTGCSLDTTVMNADEVIGRLSDSLYGVRLEPSEIYGKEEVYTLPKKKGIYRLQAELVRMGFFSDEVKQALAEHHMRVPQSNCLAPTVTIQVK